jgi:hypothetical protein
MATHGTGTFKGTSWDEQPYSEVEDGPKLSRASVTNTYSGVIEGEGTLEYLLMYRADGTCPFFGAERIVGTVDGRAGSFVLKHEGEFAQETATTTLTVVEGTGTGDLANLRGTGTFAATHDQMEYTFDYEFV